jgi:hypothetical protein
VISDDYKQQQQIKPLLLVQQQQQQQSDTSHTKSLKIGESGVSNGKRERPRKMSVQLCRKKATEHTITDICDKKMFGY